MGNSVLENVLLLIAGIGIFIFGMKFMSDGLERSAGPGMRKLLGKITNNRFAGAGVGALVTGVIQSSAATTIMVMGFVNAGLMTLFQATAIIMGANVGTTVTGILAALSGFNVTPFFGVLALVGALIVMFGKKEKYQRIGYILGGLGMIFVGLAIMGSTFKYEAIRSSVESMLSSISFPLLLILVGLLITALMQSSSAVTGVLVTMIGAGALKLEVAMFIVLGSNIGTCVTAWIASIGASTDAKRVAVIHLTNKLVGTIIFTAIIWPLTTQVADVLRVCFPRPEFQVAMFHFFFNLFTTIILLPFIKWVVKIAELVVREKRGGKDEAPHMYYIDERFLKTPAIAVAQVKSEVDHMGDMAKVNLKRAMTAVLTLDLSEKDEVERDEQRINYINKGVAKYLINLSSQSLSRSDEKFVGSLYHVIDDIERIADHAQNFMEDAQEMYETDCSFTPDALDELEDMYDKVMAMFDEAMFIFENNAVGKLKEFSEREQDIDMTKRLLANNHIARLNAGGCSVESGTHFYSIISALERIADHLTNIAFSIKSPSGSQREAMEKIAQEQKRRSREKRRSGTSLRSAENAHETTTEIEAAADTDAEKEQAEDTIKDTTD
ncbi:MAG: Na/Pi cotransporter family protein [Clostridiales bacterium]|nr:Na/Pi cotransporter family protein [Clostridiales bacterium]